MATITLKASASATQPAGTTDVRMGIENSIEQHTYVAGVALTAGCPVYLDSNSKWQKASAAAANALSRPLGLTVKKANAGEPVTAIAFGELDGYDFTNQAPGTEIFLADAAGTLADAAGTVSVKVGTVISAPLTPRGVAHKRLLRVKI